MSPAEAGAATVTVICVAVIAAYRYLCWLLDRHIRARREENRELDRWQQTAAEAARRNEDDVKADLAELRAFRQAFDDIVAIEYPAHIPQQTRRTEEDQ